MNFLREFSEFFCVIPVLLPPQYHQSDPLSHRLKNYPFLLFQKTLLVHPPVVRQVGSLFSQHYLGVSRNALEIDNYHGNI